MRKSSQKNGFTLIELIVTIALLGVIMIPAAFVSLEFTQAIPYARDLGVAEGLVKIDMAKVNNLAYMDPANATIAVGYDTTTNDYENYPYGLRRTITAGPVANLKQVQVRVYPAGETNKFLANAITYIANTPFGTGSEPACQSTQAKALVVSGGSISGSTLTAVTLKNACSSAITITGMNITFTGASGIRIQGINIGGGAAEWSGDLVSPATITLTSSFTIAANSSTTMVVTFRRNLTNPGGIVSLVFVMNDSPTKSQSISYSW